MSGFVDYVKKLRGKNSPQFFSSENSKTLTNLVTPKNNDVYNIYQEELNMLQSENLDMIP